MLHVETSLNGMLHMSDSRQRAPCKRTGAAPPTTLLLLLILYQPASLAFRVRRSAVEIASAQNSSAAKQQACEEEAIDEDRLKELCTHVKKACIDQQVRVSVIYTCDCCLNQLKACIWASSLCIL